MQLEFYVDDAWKPVVRYDNAHDFAHRDVLDPMGRQVEKKPLKLGTLAEILEFAEQDLSDRFEWYVERFLRMRGGPMKINEKGRIQRDISEAFDFVRFLIKEPRLLKKIKNGSEIAFLPAASGKAPRSSHVPKRVQAFTTETVFHTL